MELWREIFRQVASVVENVFVRIVREAFGDEEVQEREDVERIAKEVDRVVVGLYHVEQARR